MCWGVIFGVVLCVLSSLAIISLRCFAGVFCFNVFDSSSWCHGSMIYDSGISSSYELICLRKMQKYNNPFDSSKITYRAHAKNLYNPSQKTK